jgi:UPF0755 protein
VLGRLARSILVLVILATLAAAGGWYFLGYWLRQPGPLTTPAAIEFPTGTGVAGIARRLEQAGAVDSGFLFQLAVRRERQERRLRAGEYQLDPGMTPAAIIDRLVRGEILLHRIAVPEGRTVREVYAILEAADMLTGDLPAPPPEGSLLPETYLVPRGEPRAKVVDRMRAGMRKALDELWPARTPDLPLTAPEEGLTLASIVEKETALPAEYPLVASVMVNRLRRGMKLQTDPTVIYGLTQGAGALGRDLTTADLDTDHVWNTYRVPGLPPSPIANPGRAALAAALKPATTDYLYFVADGTGGHAFAATLEEHNRNVAKWRRLQRDAAPKTAGQL